MRHSNRRVVLIVVTTIAAIRHFDIQWPLIIAEIRSSFVAPFIGRLRFVTSGPSSIYL